MRTPPSTLSRLNILKTNLSNCTECSYGTYSNKKIYYRTSGKPPYKCLFVGAAPGMNDYIRNTPLTGEPGHLFDRLVKEAFPPELCGGEVSYMVTNVILCTPFTNEGRSEVERPPSVESKKACRKVWLPKLLSIIRPQYIISIGRVADSLLNQLKLPHTHVTDPSAILQDKHYELEERRFVLTLQTMIGIEQ
jgi:uracil-DNA glycosylase family 4